MLQLPIRNLNIVCYISNLHLMEDFSCSACKRFPTSVFSAIFTATYSTIRATGTKNVIATATIKLASIEGDTYHKTFMS